jgi:hypothetical protein
MLRDCGQQHSTEFFCLRALAILWNDRVDGPDHLAWIQHPGRDVEWHRVRWLCVDRRLADEHHHRQAGANRGRQRRHHLGHPRAARDGGNGELAGGYVAVSGVVGN